MVAVAVAGQRLIPELSPRTFGTLARELSSLAVGLRWAAARNFLEELSRRKRTADDHPDNDMARPQQRYDHRLRDLVQRTRDVAIATDLGVPRSTARGWLEKAPTVVVSLDVTGLTALELQQEILRLRRRATKLTALLRLALALLRSSGYTLMHERLPHGRAKIRILRAVDRAELSARTIRTFRRELSSLEWTISRRRTPSNVLEELSGVSETADDHPDDDHTPPTAAL